MNFTVVLCTGDSILVHTLSQTPWFVDGGRKRACKELIDDPLQSVVMSRTLMLVCSVTVGHYAIYAIEFLKSSC